ncbi:hypothetical protein BCS42_00440 [Crenothrix sp. D3]|nr:hypothetical protein BCS42_00440 [Crenothrix sp. D3]
MSHYKDEYKALLVDLISKAESCQIESPVEIIEIIKQQTQPNFSFDHTLFQELHTRLPLFHAYEPPSRFTGQEKHQITMLIAWLISGLQNWTKLHDTDYSELKTFLVILNRFNINNSWIQVINAIPEFMQLCVQLVQKTPHKVFGNLILFEGGG